MVLSFAPPRVKGGAQEPTYGAKVRPVAKPLSAISTDPTPPSNIPKRTVLSKIPSTLSTSAKKTSTISQIPVKPPPTSLTSQTSKSISSYIPKPSSLSSSIPKSSIPKPTIPKKASLKAPPPPVPSNALPKVTRVGPSSIALQQQELREKKTIIEQHNKNLASLQQQEQSLSAQLQEHKQLIDSVTQATDGIVNTLNDLSQQHQQELLLQQQTEEDLLNDLAQLEQEQILLLAQEAKEAQHIEAFQKSLEAENETLRSIQEEVAHLSQLTKVKQEASLCDLKVLQALDSVYRQLGLSEPFILHARSLREQLRKKLHNETQELKGNIRVLCRIRPYRGDEIESGVPLSSQLVRTSIVRATNCITVHAKPTKGVTGLTEVTQQWPFFMDCIFDEKSSQETVFQEVSQVVQSALDGFHVAIFAYGQTGSGKTYTMEGLRGDREHAGIIPRSVWLIFSKVEALRGLGWQYSVSVSVCEVYNETIVDLLGGRGGKGEEKKGEDKKGERVGAKRGVMVDEDVSSKLTWVEASSAHDVSKLFDNACTKRSVAATDANAHSSRSHLIFQMRLAGENDKTNEKVQGNLCLIDLAGSERNNATNAVGTRLKESNYINRSLSALADVIAQLADENCKHVSFRNSKLTMLLRPSLGGSSKTLLFLNISPLQKHMNESINSLRFSQKVAMVKQQSKVKKM